MPPTAIRTSDFAEPRHKTRATGMKQPDAPSTARPSIGGAVARTRRHNRANSLFLLITRRLRRLFSYRARCSSLNYSISSNQPSLSMLDDIRPFDGLTVLLAQA
jgi:hypothetical protein